MYISVGRANIARRVNASFKNIYEMKSDGQSKGALAYKIGDKIYFIAPLRSQYTSINLPQGKYIGELVEVKGNPSSKETSIIKPLGVPAMVQTEDGKLYFNAHVFTNFQKFLQFEYDITPYLCWRDRLFWLDEFANDIADIIYRFSPENVEFKNQKPSKMVCFRHDVDDSDDLSFLNYANEKNIPTTYAVLFDRRMKFWIQTLKKNPLHECGFHWASNHVSWVMYFKVILNKLFGTHFTSGNYPKKLSKKTLTNLVKKAKRRGMQANTIMRHFSFMCIPEYFDALEDLSNEGLCVGGGDFLQASVLRNGSKTTNGESSGYTHFAHDIGASFHAPFKVYNPKTKREINFWQTGTIQEPHIEIAKYYLNKKLTYVKEFFFIFSFHPAHASTPNFVEGGQIETFKSIIALKEKYNIKFKQLQTILKEQSEKFN